MKTEQESVLQKKIIIIFSLLILTVTMGILNIQKEFLSRQPENNVSETQKAQTDAVANQERFSARNRAAQQISETCQIV